MMRNYFNLENRIAVITGGYGYIGTALTNALLNAGARVIVAGRSEEKFLQKFGNCDSQKIEFKYCDITKDKTFESIFNSVVANYNSLDIIVNNAHTVRGKGVEEISDEDWRYTMDGVLGSIQKSIKAAIPYMKKQKRGKIINISSMYGLVSPNFNLYSGKRCEKYFNPPHYGAAKAGMLQLTRYYAAYLGKYNIQVNAITPGPFPKLEIQKENKDFIERLKERNPLNKIGKPEDIIGTLLLLGSDASDFITGQNIVIDGGWTIW
jgi:gluconate 5-dehydrogenase